MKKIFPSIPQLCIIVGLFWLVVVSRATPMTLVLHNDSNCTNISSGLGFWIPSIDVGDNAVPGQYVFQRAGPHGNNDPVTVTVAANGMVSWSGDFGNVVGAAVFTYGNDWTWTVVQVPTGGTAS